MLETYARNDLLLALQGVAKKGKFTLSSGGESDFYIDCRPLLGAYHTLRIASDALVACAQKLDLPFLAGPATAAIAYMASAVTSDDEAPPAFNYVRSRSKGHGTGQQVEGPDFGEGAKILLVDDVLTTGGSLLRCASHMMTRYPDAEIVGAWVLVDRQEGGVDALAAQSIPTFAVTTRAEILGE